MSEEVYKGSITIEIMGKAESAAQYKMMLSNMSLEDILTEAQGGDLIAGTHCLTQVEHIHKDQVQAELEEMGNDGTFFDTYDDDSEEEDDPE